jgi:hypothetical protein
MFLYQDRIVDGIWFVVLGTMFTCYGLFFKKHFLLTSYPGQAIAMPRWVGLVFYVGMGLIFLTFGILQLVKH